MTFDGIWVLASEYTDGRPGITQGRTIDHIGFEVASFDEVSMEMSRLGVEFRQEPAVPDNARSSSRQAFILGPDGVTISIVEPGWEGIEEELAVAEAQSTELYVIPKTPWGEPDIQGI